LKKLMVLKALRFVLVKERTNKKDDCRKHA